MKFVLPEKIETVEQAEDYLRLLHSNSMSYHPEDDAREIEWDMPDNERPTTKECKKMNKLMEQIYNLPGNENVENMIFDPCGFLLELDDQVVPASIADLSPEDAKYILNACSTAKLLTWIKSEDVTGSYLEYDNTVTRNKLIKEFWLLYLRIHPNAKLPE